MEVMVENVKSRVQSGSQGFKGIAELTTLLGLLLLVRTFGRGWVRFVTYSNIVFIGA